MNPEEPTVLPKPEVVQAHELTPAQKETARMIKQIAGMSKEREAYVDRVIETYSPEDVVAALKWLTQVYHDRFIEAAGLIGDFEQIIDRLRKRLDIK
jgi:hypothetical protein